ncbi:hypothetical protein PENTCL1PPCAC_10158, partial [Pristionchus entomophagus]
MASSRAGEVSLRNGPSPKCKWIFSKEEMMNMASLREGVNEFKELQFRQQSTKFIQLLGDRLNQPLRDSRGKMDPRRAHQAITQLCMCAAMIHMHRFFYFHSFTFFDYRDVAAACLFLSGKSEECPRKIDHIVKAWWHEKFPGIKLDQQKYDDAMGLLVAIESIILQTIAFDLQVALPHPLVLKVMHAIAKNDRKTTEVAYFFSTDVLCVTSWGIRYSAEAIAVACVHIVCTWANVEIPLAVDGTRWYHRTDPTMTEEQLQEMMREFISVYRTCKNDLAITKFIKKGEIRDPISDAESSDRVTPPARVDTPEMRLPPPPPPPLSLASKKVDINAYKERRAADAGSGSSSSGGFHAAVGAAGSAHSQQQQPKRMNFMPEMNQMKGVTATMAGFVPPKQEIKQEQGERKPDYSREDPYRSSSSYRPARPPSNGSSGAPPPQQLQQQPHPHPHQQRPSHYGSGSGGSQQHYMQQQQPSGSSDRSAMAGMGGGGGGERGRDAERERNEKRKREMSSASLNSDKRTRMDMPMQGSGGPPQRGHSMMPPQSGLQQPQPLQHNAYNSVPPPQPLMQQPQPMMQQAQHYGGSSKHYSGGPMSNGHHQQQQHQSMQPVQRSYGSAPYQQQQ